MAEGLQDIISEWKIKDPASVTDNARNICNACDIAGVVHMGCAAHTLNFAVNQALEVPEIRLIIKKCCVLVRGLKKSAIKKDSFLKAEDHLEKEVKQCFTNTYILYILHNEHVNFVNAMLHVYSPLTMVFYNSN